MFDAELIFRDNASRLDRALENALNNLKDMQLRLESRDATEYHYKNQHLSWCKTLIQERNQPPESYRVSVWLTYGEPAHTGEVPALHVRVVAEVFQSGMASRTKKEFTKTEEINDRVLNELTAFIRQLFDQAWESLDSQTHR